MAKKDYNYRRFKRYVHGMRRLRQDRAQHGGETSCPCFESEASLGRGIVFDRFADHPATCSGWCCGNQRKVQGPTRKEKIVRD